MNSYHTDWLAPKTDPCKTGHARLQHAISVFYYNFHGIDSLAVLVAGALSPDLGNPAGESAPRDRLHFEPYRTVQFHIGYVTFVNIDLKQEPLEFPNTADLLPSAEVAGDGFAKVLAEHDAGPRCKYSHAVVFSL